MTIHKRSRMEDPFLMGFDFSQLKYAITDGVLPATATLTETLEFFPCYDDVLPMMLSQFEMPDFYLTFLPETLLLNIKISEKHYQRIPLQNVHGKCSEAVGHSFIHIIDGSAAKWLREFKQINWTELEFEDISDTKS